MGKISETFEYWIEKWMSGNLERWVTILAWMTLFFLAICVWLIIHFAFHPISVLDSRSGAEREILLKDLLIRKD